MRLRTERLTLREFTMDDGAALYGLESIPEVARYQTYPPRTLDQAREAVAEIVRGQSETPRRHVELAVCPPLTPSPSSPRGRGEFIGRVGAWVEGGTAALWYAFLPSARGKGYATEAVRALIPFLGASRLTIECDPRNEASWRLAERLGFERASFTERAFECKGEWVGSLVYVRGVE